MVGMLNDNESNLGAGRIVNYPSVVGRVFGVDVVLAQVCELLLMMDMVMIMMVIIIIIVSMMTIVV